MESTAATVHQIVAKSFELHDGEDDERTTELHRFMMPLIEGRHIYEWEGTGTPSIVITLDVNPGDTIQASADGWIRVVRKGAR
jgi:hypothetical protein